MLLNNRINYKKIKIIDIVNIIEFQFKIKIIDELNIIAIGIDIDINEIDSYFKNIFELFLSFLYFLLVLLAFHITSK